MRLLLITPRVDPNDDLFGHVHAWATALARRVERLYVVALWDGNPKLPANARFASLGKGSTADKALWLARLQRLVGRLCSGGRVDAVLAHMAPVFAVAAAPIARLTRTPVVLWYAHGHVSPMLRLAHALVDGVGTSTPDGFRIPSGKVTVTGQGIDTDRFAPAGKAPGGPPIVLSVGRFSPIKDYETLLDAFARLPADGAATCPARLELLGGVHSGSEREYLEDLRRRAARLGLADGVSFSTGLPHSQIAPVYQRATLFASCSRTGSLDKAVLEAAACGVPPLVGNVAFRPFLGAAWGELSFPPGDAAALAERLAGWLARGDGERRELALRLRAVVEREHSLAHLADSLIAMIGRRVGRS